MKVYPKMCMLSLLLLVSVIIRGSHSQIFNHCPDSFLIMPCSCLYLSSENVGLLDCSGVRSEQQLSDIFHTTNDFPSMEFKEFNIFNNPKIKVFNDDIFGNISFVELTVTGGVLEKVEADSLALSFKSMTKMDLRRNTINAVEDFPFSEIPNYKKLTHLYLSENNFPSWPTLMSDSIIYLDMSQNPLTVIPTDAFSQLPKLEELYLRDVKLGNIDAGTFDGLENLNHLELSHNQLSVLSANSFSTDSLQRLALYLDFNDIQTVEINSFTSGGLMNMYGNKITTLDEEVWRPHLQAEGALSIGGNPLSWMSNGLVGPKP
ncbi:unnamed protein product [Meganyctiphanes norvegica]|uniref:Uncharacterized protein n=1 Tax=Meganyctiphanes norvegica TaxID=48144 RepID=A0AAV2RJX5_MEGNR